LADALLPESSLSGTGAPSNHQVVDYPGYTRHLLDQCFELFFGRGVRNLATEGYDAVAHLKVYRREGSCVRHLGLHRLAYGQQQRAIGCGDSLVL
jgi:hypothetical protein